MHDLQSIPPLVHGFLVSYLSLLCIPLCLLPTSTHLSFCSFICPLACKGHRDRDCAVLLLCVSTQEVHLLNE